MKARNELENVTVPTPAEVDRLVREGERLRSEAIGRMLAGLARRVVGLLRRPARVTAPKSAADSRTPPTGLGAGGTA